MDGKFRSPWLDDDQLRPLTLRLQEVERPDRMGCVYRRLHDHGDSCTQGCGLLNRQGDETEDLFDRLLELCMPEAGDGVDILTSQHLAHDFLEHVIVLVA